MANFSDLTFLYVAGDLESVQNSQAFTLSCWVRYTDTDMVIYNAEGRVRLRVRSSGGLNFKADNTSNVSVIEVQTDNAYNDGEWHHILITGDHPNSSLHVDGVSDLEVLKYIPGEIQFAIGGFSDHGLGAVVQDQMGDPADNYNGDVEDFYLNIRDAATSSEDFYNEGRISLGDAGQLPLPSLPIIYFSEGTWDTHKGTGGPWQREGDVTESTSAPPAGITPPWTVETPAGSSYTSVSKASSAWAAQSKAGSSWTVE